MQEVAACSRQVYDLLLCFDAFSDDSEAELVGDVDDGLDEGSASSVLWKALYEGLVDLGVVDGEVDETGERREAGPEVVDGQGVAPVAMLGEPGCE